jgi:hypothetical protein
VYFHQYPLDASFHKFLGPSINNDYANLCIWSLLKLLKIVHIGKYLIIMDWCETNFEGVIEEVYQCPIKFFIEYKHYKVVVLELD